MRNRFFHPGSDRLAALFSRIAILFLVAGIVHAQAPTPAAHSSASAPEKLVAGIYDLVSAPPGQLPDWAKVRACFMKEAVIVLRTSREATSTFSVDGFLKDFTDFYERPFKTSEGAVIPKDKGFKEKVIRIKSREFGDMAQVLVLYEAQILGISKGPQPGIDDWLLARRDGRWLVAAITNEVVTRDRPVPEEWFADVPAGPLASLQAKLDSTVQSGALEAALNLSDGIAALTEQEHYESLFRLAVFQARLGHREQAYRSLQRAIGAGFNNRARLLQEEAFQPFREEELFRTLARKAWANGYIGLLERANREEVQKSPEIMKALAFRPGEKVADIGAGSGYFTIPIAQAVGPNGIVWALDIAPEMLEYLEFRVQSLKMENVRLRKVAGDNPQLDPGSVDTILMIDTLHYVKDRVAYAKKLRTGLAPGGRFVLIDYLPKPVAERPWGPPPEQQIPRETIDREMQSAGFQLEKSYDFLPEQYFLVYSPVGQRN